MPLVVKDGKILLSGVAIGSTDWQAFLSSNRSFRYESASYGGYTATKQGEYWYASRKYQGTLYRKYVGATKDLNVELLEEAAIALTEMTSNHQKPDKNKPEQNNGELHKGQLHKQVEYLTGKVEQMEGELRILREELHQVKTAA